MSHDCHDVTDVARAQSKQAVLLESLRKFYGAPAHLRVLTEVLRNESRISLRILDWLVTNYSKKRNVTYLVQGPDGPQVFNLFLQYKSQLKAYSKKHFDPFCRRERLAFLDARGQQFETTVGQLNFFRWALVNGVIEYGIAHGAQIEADMMQSIRHRYSGAPVPAAAAAAGATAPAAAAPGEKPKRKELSKAAIKTATRTMVKVTVRFT